MGFIGRDSIIRYRVMGSNRINRSWRTVVVVSVSQSTLEPL